MSIPFMISVMAQDRVGIIADVTGAVKHLGGNLEDISQTVLRGYFTMLLLARFPSEMTAERVRNAFSENLGTKDLQIGVVPFTGDCSVPKIELEDVQDAYVVTASGPDKVGLVAALSEYLRLKDVNILDLATRSENGTYTMILLVRLPSGTDVAKLKRSLQTSMEEHDMKVELRHQAIFRKVNDI